MGIYAKKRQRGIITFKKAILLFKTHRKPVNYLIFGAATTLINWCTYGLLMRFAGLSITWANIIAWVLSVTFAFFTNKILVFESHSWQLLLVLREAGAFLGARIVSGLAEIIGVPLLYRGGLDYPLLGIEGFAAKLAVSLVVITLNYFFSKMFIFRRGKND